MYSKTGLWLEAELFVLTFFVVIPSIAAAIGYAAWKGKPKNFNREMLVSQEAGYFWACLSLTPLA